jgi:ketosteroid isomerase-like protein
MDRNIILEFIDLINKHELEGMSGMLSDDHAFFDAYNNSVAGKENMIASWKVYFDWFPDYTIEVCDIIQGGNCTAVFGFANGTYRNLHNPERTNHFHLPAAWRVIVENDKIKQWQVYSDTKIPSEIMEKNKTVI